MQKNDSLTLQSPFRGLTRAQRENFVVITCKAAIGVGAFLGVLYGILYLSRPAWQLVVSAGQLVPTVLISLLAMRLARHGRVELGTSILLGYLLGMTALISVILGLLPAIAPVYMVFIMVAGMVFGAVGGYAIAGAASLLWLGAFLGVGLGLPSSTPLSGITAQVALVILTEVAYLLTAFLSHSATGQLWRALDDAAYDLIEANRKLGEANAQKSRFLARMSHDLRTPLTAVMLSTDLTLRKLYGPLTEKQEEVLRSVLQSAKRLQDLIDDILDISKIEAGQLKLTEKPFVISTIVEAVRSTIEPKAHRKGLAFSISVSSRMPPYMVGDENRLTQILMNLADNAVKFTEQGEVAVLIEPHNSTRWHMQVRDTGRGIHEADLGIIFEEFRQADNAADSVQGTGLGLAIVRHLVQMMQGDIRVTSQIGRGSTFDVSLPLKAIDRMPDAVV